MNKRIKLVMLCMLAMMTTAFFAVPNTANAFEDPKKPVATNVHYYPNDTVPVKDRTGIKSFSLAPYTYYNLSKDTNINPDKKDTIKLDDATIKRIVKNQIFPKWSVIADGIFRDQADQLVTIKGTGMMSSSTSASNSFDRQFNTGKNGVSGYSNKWAIGDLAYELRQEGTYTNGSVLKDELRREGISTIGSLKDARTMMGQSLRNCSDDNDNTVDDFLGNSKQKTDSAYRLPTLDDDKTGSGYCNIVTCINQAAVNDYDYVTFGLAVYDFDVTPVAAKNLKYIEDAQKIDGGEDILMGRAGNYDDQKYGVHFSSSSREGTKSHFKNETASENTQSAGLETSTTEENTISQDETYEHGMEQEIGMEWNFGGWGDGDCMFPRLTVNMSNTWHELWSTTKSNSQTNSVTKTKNINTELTLPPDTIATVVQNIDNKNVEEDYQQPVVLNYKVAIFAMSGDFYNGTCGGIEPSRYDKQWMTVIFDGSDDKAVSGCDALGGLYRSVTDGTNRYDSAKGKLNSWCDKGAFTKSESINWDNIATNIANDNRGTRNIVSSKTGKKATLEQMASELPLLEKAQTLESKQMTSTASVDQIMPLHPLQSVSLKSAQKNYSITPEEKFYLDNLELEGTDKNSAEYYGFNSDWGQWYLLDENNNIIEDGDAKDDSGEKGIVQFNALRLHTDEITDSQWIETVGNQSSPAQHVKWVLEDESKSKIVYNDSPSGMTSEELKNVSTPALSIQVVNQKDDIDRVVVTGDYREPYDEPANLGSVFKAKAVDGDGKKKNVQILWEGDGDDDYEVEENGKITFDKPGTYNVRAFCIINNTEGRPVKKTSEWIEVKAVEKSKLDRMEFELPDDLSEEDTTINKENQSLGFDLDSYVDLYDQYDEKWNGARPEIKFDVTDRNGNEINGANIDHNNVLTITQKGRYKVTAKAVDSDDEDLGIGNPSLTIVVTEEDWLDQIIFKEPACSTDELSLKGVDDEVRIDGLSNQLVYVDQNGDIWEGNKKPPVEFYLESETNSARVTGDSFFASEPGTYKIGASAANYEIEPVTVTIGEKSDNFIKTVDPDDLIIDEIGSDGQFETIEYDLMRSVDYTTQRGSKWNDKYPKPAMKFTIEGEHNGASIEDGNIFKVNEPGTYTIHVEPKKASEYSAPIDDIEINVIIDRQIKYVAVDFRGLRSAERRMESGSYVLSDLANYVKYYDQFWDEFKESDLEKYKHEMPKIKGFGLKFVEGSDGQAENQQHGTITSEYDYAGSRTIYNLQTDTPGEYEVAPVYAKGTAGDDLIFIYGTVNVLGENEEDSTEGKVIEKIGSFEDYSGDDQQDKYFYAYVALGELYDYADPADYSDESTGDTLSDRAKVSKIISDAADDIERIMKDESISFESAEGQFKSIVDDAKSEIDKFKTTEQRENDRAKVRIFTSCVNALDATKESFTEDVINARELYNELTADQKDMVAEETIAKLEEAESSIKDAIELDNAKKAAKKELDDIDVSAYSGEDKTAVENAISDGKSLIDGAEKISIVEMNLQYTKGIIAGLKTDEQKAADKDAYDMSKAKEVMRKIDAIPEDPGTDEDGKVNDALKAYEALTQSQKDFVDAAYYNRLMAAEESVQVVTFTKEMIGDIPAKLTHSDHDQSVVLIANMFYDILTDTQKSHISEDELTKMQDATAALDVIKFIYELKSPEDLTDKDIPVVESARAAYNALTADQKEMISDVVLERLEMAEAAVELLDLQVSAGVREKIKEMMKLIDQIPDELTANDASAVNYAKNYYDTNIASSTEAATFISGAGYKKLTDSKAAIDPVVKIDGLSGKLPSGNDQVLENAIEEAQKGLNSLTDVQKQRVDDELIEKLHNYAQAKAVVEEISALPDNVGADDAGAVNAAVKKYEALTADQQKLIDPDFVKTLTNKEAAVANAISEANQAAADAVKDKIEAIPELAADPDEADINAFRSKVNDARAAYDALTDDQKILVDNYSELELAEARLEGNGKLNAIDTSIYSDPEKSEAEKAIAAAKESINVYSASKEDVDLIVGIIEGFVSDLKTDAQKEQDKVDDVIKSINELPAEVTVDDEAKITGVRAAYDVLSDSQKGQISNYDKLVAAEEALETAKAADAAQKEKEAANKEAADKVTEQINDLPADPGLDDEEAVKAAREAYDALTDDQKAKVSNYGTLTAAENSVENAKQKAAEDKAAADKEAAGKVRELINEIPAVPKAEDEEKVKRARAAYDKLTDDQKALIDGKLLRKLEDAEKTTGDEIALKDAMTAAKEELNSIDLGKYDEKDITKIEKIIKDAKADIEKAKDVAEVESAMNYARSRIALYKTTAEKNAESRAKQRGKDGTFYGKGASFEAMNNNITRYANNTDPKGTEYGVLQVKSTKQTVNSIGLKWKKAKNTVKYVVYGAKSGKDKFVQITETKGTAYNVKKVNTALNKKSYYKFIVVAVDQKNNVVSSSKIVHVATKGSKKCANCKKLIVKSKVNKKGKVTKKYKAVSAIKLRAGSGNKKLKKKAKLKVKEKAPKKSKIRKYMKPRFESSNEKIVKVSKTGVVKAVKKGKAVVYVFAQNGVSKAIKVKVVK